MQGPGALFPVSQPVMVASTPGVVYYGSVPIGQSADSEVGFSGRLDIETKFTLVPDDGLQAEDTLCDGINSVVDVAGRRTPELRQSTAVEVRDDLHCPAESRRGPPNRESSHWASQRILTGLRRVTVRVGPDVNAM